MNPFDVLSEIPGGVPEPTAELLGPVWKQIVGETVARHTEIIDVVDQRVCIAVDPAWQDPVKAMVPDLLKELSKATPWEFKSCALRQRKAPAPTRASRPVREKTARPPAAGTLEALDEIEDPEIRQLSERILERVLKGD